MVPTPTQPLPPTNPQLVHKRHGSCKYYLEVEEEEKEHEMEEVKQQNQMPSKEEVFNHKNQSCYAPNVTNGSKWLFKGDLLEGKGK
jgi:hypothetical protein